VVDAERGERWVVMAHIHPLSLAHAPRADAAGVVVRRLQTARGELVVLPRVCQGVEQANHVGGALADVLAPLSWLIIYSLWLRYVFWVADTHLGNVLVSDRRADGRYYVCASVDASENRGARKKPLHVDKATVKFLMPKRQTPETRVLVAAWTRRHRDQLLAAFSAWRDRAALVLDADSARDARIALAMQHIAAMK